MSTTPPDSSAEPLTLEQLVDWAGDRTRLLYEGTVVAHRSCGIALAETFGRETRPYQALRRGGITGDGQCGAIKAGELILGELFGDPDPTGAVTDTLRRAILRYRTLWRAEVDRGEVHSIICNDLTGQFETFHAPERHHFCTQIAEDVARCVARTVIEMGAQVETTPAPER
ncbi:MAG: C-GCAxxG-C-C family protein [Myxococcota bacterium]